MSTARNQYKFPRWLVEALRVYFVDTRQDFLKNHRDSTMKFQRLDPTGVEKRPIRTELLFVNSAGNHDFRVKHVSDQFMVQVQKKMENRDDVLKMKVAELIPVICSPDVQIPKLKEHASKVYASASVRGYSYKEVKKAVRSRQDAQRNIRQGVRAFFFQ